jgi:tight adherence protein B
MSTNLVTLVFTFAGTTLFVGVVLSIIYEALFRYPQSVRERLAELAGRTKVERNSLLVDIRQMAESASQVPGDWRVWLRDRLEQSGLRVKLRTLITISLSAGIGLALFVALASGRWWTFPLGLAVGLVTPWAYVWLKRKWRLRRLILQLPDALDIICRAVRAGQTVPATFQMVADNFPPPISDEFRYCYEQQNLGISYDVALRNLARGTGIMELRILVVALLVQSRSGGNLTDMLQNLATMIRKRLSLQNKVRALTGEGRMQAGVLAVLPVVVFFAMYFLNPEYAQILLDRPLLLLGCALSQAIGIVIILKLIKIEY